MRGNSYISSFKPANLLLVLRFVLIVLFLDFSIGYTLRYFFFKQISGPYRRVTYSLEESTEDILVFGSSLAHHNFIPSLITEMTGLSCYNTGRDGADIYYYSALQQGIFKRYTPKIILMNINLNELLNKKDSLQRLSYLLPYYETHEEIRPIIEQRSRFEKIKLLSNIYPFNSAMLTIAKYNVVHDKDDKGYIPLNTSVSEREMADALRVEPVATTTNAEIDSTLVFVFETFIQNCTETPTELIIVFSPTYKLYPHENEMFQLIQSIAGKHEIALWDYSQDSTFTNRHGFFTDRMHLNHRGAQLFSEQIARRIYALTPCPSPANGRGENPD